MRKLWLERNGINNIIFLNYVCCVVAYHCTTLQNCGGMKDVYAAYFKLKSLFGTLNVNYNKNDNFIIENKMCCNGITKLIH